MSALHTSRRAARVPARLDGPLGSVLFTARSSARRVDIAKVTKEEIRAVVVLVSSRTRSHIRLVSRVWPGFQIGSDI